LIAIVHAPTLDNPVYNVVRRNGVHVGVNDFLETEKVCVFGKFFDFFIPFANVGKLYGVT